MFGIPSHRHLMKIYPFTVRLMAATKTLRQSMQRGDQKDTARGIEDVGFWTARLVSEMISGQEEGEENLDVYREAMQALFEAQRVGAQARKGFGAVSYGGFASNPGTGESMLRAAGFVSGPVLLYAAGRLDQKWLSDLVAIMGLGVSAWAVWSWKQDRVPSPMGSPGGHDTMKLLTDRSMK